MTDSEDKEAALRRRLNGPFPDVQALADAMHEYHEVWQEEHNKLTRAHKGTARKLWEEIHKLDVQLRQEISTAIDVAMTADHGVDPQIEKLRTRLADLKRELQADQVAREAEMKTGLETLKARVAELEAEREQHLKHLERRQDALIEHVEDLEDKAAIDRTLAEMERTGEKPIPWEQVKKDLGP